MIVLWEFGTRDYAEGRSLQIGIALVDYGGRMKTPLLLIPYESSVEFSVCIQIIGPR